MADHSVARATIEGAAASLVEACRAFIEIGERRTPRPGLLIGELE
jgi:hypothetical protein